MCERSKVSCDRSFLFFWKVTEVFFGGNKDRWGAEANGEQVRPIECLLFVVHFPQKSPVVSGSFAERDLQLIFWR